jgi:hypothetical protein
MGDEEEPSGFMQFAQGWNQTVKGWYHEAASSTTATRTPVPAAERRTPVAAARAGPTVATSTAGPTRAACRTAVGRRLRFPVAGTGCP